MKPIYLLLTLFFLSSGLAHASNGCPHGQAIRGPLAGKCLSRTVPTPQLISENAIEIVLRNVIHHNRLGYVALPMNQLMKAELVLNSISNRPLSSTALVEFRFAKNSVRWFESEAHLSSGIPDQVFSDLVIHTLPVGTLNSQFNLLDGATGKFALGYEAISAEELIYREVRLQNNFLKHWELKLNRPEVARLLRTFASRAEKNNLRLPFHTLRNNSATEILHALGAKHVRGLFPARLPEVMKGLGLLKP